MSENKNPPPGGRGSNEPTLIMGRADSASKLEPPAPSGQGSNEPTVIVGSPGGAATAPQPATPPPSDATVVGKSAYVVEMLGQKPPTPDKPTERLGSGSAMPSAKSIHNQDTVVSPRLKQLAQTPSQPVRPLSGMASKAAQPAASSSSRMIMLIGIVAILILLAAILVAVLMATRGPTLLAGLTATKTPTPTATRPATPTSIFPPTFTPTRILSTPTVPPTPVPPTATARPAPTALAVNVLARVTPPEGLKLKVRDSATTAGKLLGELEQGTQVAILEGPTDADGIRWWKVDNTKGLIGWSAEGLGGDKYLVPVGWAK